MNLIVGRIGKPHGLHGEVTINVRTDDPIRRFQPGTVLHTDPAASGPLTVRSMREHNAVTLLSFEEITDRTAAENLRGTVLTIDVSNDPEEDNAWHRHELVGLIVRDLSGAPIGHITNITTGGAQDLLHVRTTPGHDALVPFVYEIVPTVNIQGGYVVIDPPGGLLDSDEQPNNG